MAKCECTLFSAFRTGSANKWSLILGPISEGTFSSPPVLAWQGSAIISRIATR